MDNPNSLSQNRLVNHVAMIVLAGTVLQAALILAVQFAALGRDDEIFREGEGIYVLFIALVLGSFWLVGVPIQKLVLNLTKGLGRRVRRVLSCLAVPVGVALVMVIADLVSLKYDGATWTTSWQETVPRIPEITGLTLAFLALPTLVATLWALWRDKTVFEPTVDQIFG